jgi:ferredoxin
MASRVAGTRVATRPTKTFKALNTARVARVMTVSAFKVTLITPAGPKEIECDGETYIIDAAEEAGIDMPYSCRSGACSTCVGILQKGAVNQDDVDKNMREDEMLVDGVVWTCMACPTEDVTILTEQEPNMHKL